MSRDMCGLVNFSSDCYDDLAQPLHLYKMRQAKIVLRQLKMRKLFAFFQKLQRTYIFFFIFTFYSVIRNVIRKYLHKTWSSGCWGKKRGKTGHDKTRENGEIFGRLLEICDTLIFLKVTSIRKRFPRVCQIKKLRWVGRSVHLSVRFSLLEIALFGETATAMFNVSKN